MVNSVLFVGGGTASLFCAYELIEKGFKGKITIIEEGKDLKNRYCPKNKTGKCEHCKICAVTRGLSGAGSFSDAKLSLGTDVGGSLPDLLGEKFTQELINYTDSIFLKFGADTTVVGLEDNEEIRDIKRRAIAAGVKLVEDPIRHLGTEKSRELYQKLENYLIEKGVEIIPNTKIQSLSIIDNTCYGVKTINNIPYTADVVVVAVGRSGASWLEDQCKHHKIERVPGTMDIGVRVECRNEIMEKINKYFYEGKFIGYPAPFKDKVRTFCQNPGGFVAQENYEDGLALVNGHSYKDLKSKNTNLAILVSHNFTTPFDQPILYAQKIGELTNMLGAGSILVQRFGDILAGKRTWQKELEISNIKPTLPDAVAGDITAAMPYRTMTDIISFIQMLDKVVPGFASNETLLYSPEIKFYSNKVKMDGNLNTSVKNLYCLGDSSGITRGLMQASAMGIHCAHQILNK